MLLHQFQTKKEATPTKALSSGYMNNCGLNSLIHLWLNLPEEKFIELFHHFPVFQQILNEFCALYGVKNNDLQTLLAFKNLPTMQNPWDRELIWGEVFRRVLRKLGQAEVKKNAAIAENIAMAAQALRQTGETVREEDLYNEQLGEGYFEFAISDEQELKYALSGRALDWRLLRLLTKEMGLTLTVHNQATKIEGYVSKTADLEQLSHTYKPDVDGGWNATLFFNGGHYDFTYGCPFKDAMHNAIRGEDKSFILKGLSQMLNADFTYQALKGAVATINEKTEDKITEEDLELIAQFNAYQAQYLCPKIHKLIGMIYANVEKLVAQNTATASTSTSFGNGNRL